MDILTGLNLVTLQAPYHDGGGEWWWIGRLLVFLLWIAVIVFAVRWFARNRRHDPSPMDRARGILAERYARGEIDAEEYRQRSEQLTS